MRLTGGQIVAKALKANGVDYVTGMPSDGSRALVEALLTAGTDIPFIQVMQEQSSVHLADGYFRACGRPMGVLLPVSLSVSSALGGVASALADSSAMLVISSDSVRRDAHRPDVSRLGITKKHLLVSAIDQLPQALRQAFEAMFNGRSGPVSLDIAADVQRSSIEVDVPRAALRAPSETQRANPESIERAANALCGAARPVILVGDGVIAVEASAQLLALTEGLLAPVLTTAHEKGVLAEDHPLSVGVIDPMGSHPLLETADVVLVVGRVRLAEPCDAQLIVIDGAPIEGQLVGGLDVRIAADINSALSDLAEVISSSPPKSLLLRRAAYCREIAGLQEARALRLIEDSVSDAPPLIVQRPLAELRLVLERDAILVVGAGSIQVAVSQMFPVYYPRSHLCTASSSTLGWAVPAAIGAKLAMPARQVVCVVGSADFLQSMQEIAVCVMHSIPVVFLVFNSSESVSLSDVQAPIIEQHQVGEFNLPDGKPYSPDFAGIARNFGLDAWRVEHASQLNTTFIKALNSKGPSLVEVITARGLRVGSG